MLGRYVGYLTNMIEEMVLKLVAASFGLAPRFHLLDVERGAAEGRHAFWRISHEANNYAGPGWVVLPCC
jgi:hypothetical protein